MPSLSPSTPQHHQPSCKTTLQTTRNRHHGRPAEINLNHDSYAGTQVGDQVLHRRQTHENKFQF